MINIISKFLTLVNFILPKNKSHVLLVPFPNSESGCIAVANYIAKNISAKKVFIVMDPSDEIPYSLLDSKINVIERNFRLSPIYLYRLFTSKFIFFTHGLILKEFPRSQFVINLWHGILYKNIVMLLGSKPMISDLVVGTSEAVQEMFSKAFGVQQSQVTTGGYPRNDNLLNGQLNKEKILANLGLTGKIVLLWMPTYRKSVKGDIRVDGNYVENPFCIENFDVVEFNAILEKFNAVCFVKPHPMAPLLTSDGGDLKNLKFIDNNWILQNELDLYEFVGATDILISDVSSIIIDYLLLNQPILCISEDFEQYKNTRGFYFKDIEDKIPTKVLRNQHEFFNNLTHLLSSQQDPYQVKREELKKYFFKYHDVNSTKRLCNLIFNS